MIIAVNTRLLLNDHQDGYSNFLYSVLDRITRNYSSDQFIFIFDRQHEKNLELADNVKPVVIGPPARHPLSWKYWYDLKIPSVLKKYKADVFVSCDGFCSLTTSLPQCLVIRDLAFLHESHLKGADAIFYKHYVPKFLKKAKTVVTVSSFSKDDILHRYKIESSKLTIIPIAAKEIFRPLTETQKQNVKDKFSDGKEYFVYGGSADPDKNLTNLLKAFSVFKKRQASNLKLILAGSTAAPSKDFLKSLSTYKYRGDVVMAGQLEDAEYAAIIGGAYAFVSPFSYEGFGSPVLQAIRCHVPVITSTNSAMQEVAGDAALYVNPADHLDIAEKMMLLYKDENLRSQLVEKGQIISEPYTWDRSVDAFWTSVMKTLK